MEPEFYKTMTVKKGVSEWVEENQNEETAYFVISTELSNLIKQKMYQLLVETNKGLIELWCSNNHTNKYSYRTINDSSLERYNNENPDFSSKVQDEQYILMPKKIRDYLNVQENDQIDIYFTPNYAEEPEFLIKRIKEELRPNLAPNGMVLRDVTSLYGSEDMLNLALSLENLNRIYSFEDELKNHHDKLDSVNRKINRIIQKGKYLNPESCIQVRWNYVNYETDNPILLTANVLTEKEADELRDLLYEKRNLMQMNIEIQK